jgi:predicted RNA-binding Zn-ribbon protein involved in translation (DUF1610 family)
MLGSPPTETAARELLGFLANPLVQLTSADDDRPTRFPPGIRCVLVDAYKTSQKCAVCRREGIRASENTKLFHCPHCSSIVDADLNGARNITKSTIIKTISVSSLQ